MKSLDDYNIHEHLPDSLAKQNIIELAKVIDEQLHEINALSELALVYPRIDELTEEFIDELAVQFHVDFYSSTLPIEKKRALVKNSIAWHMRKGTASVVREMAKVVFDDAEVEEWFEYGGDPYYFRITTLLSEMSMDGIESVVKLVNAVKNVRSWLDGIGFLRPVNATLYGGFAPILHKRIKVFPASIQDARMPAPLYVGAVPIVHKRVEILPAYARDETINAKKRGGFVPSIHRIISIQQEVV